MRETDGNHLDKARRHTARKRFGQNFLQDPGIISRIVEAIGPANNDHLVEIGPGQAALTTPVIAALGNNNRLNLIEIDRDLAAGLQQQFGADPRVSIHVGDALDIDFGELRQQAKTPLRVFGNLPYNISTPLIFHLLQHTQTTNAPAVIADMHFMLQREVVERMAATPGSKTYGRLSVMTQYYCQVEPLFDVPPECFSPKPKVMSAIVRLLPYAKAPVIADNPATLDQVVKAAFAQRRKTLRNGLKTMIDTAALHALDIDPGARAETLEISHFVTIANAINVANKR